MSILYSDLVQTTFPNSLDNIQQMLSVTVSDAPLIKSFQQYIMDGNFSAAQTILDSIQNADRKILSADYINTLRDAILALERFYKSDIKPYVNSLQTTWTSLVDQLKFMDYYNPATLYEKNNYVLYTVNGQLLVFIATQNPPLATAPTNETYWRQLTVRGARGPSGPGASFRYDWEESEIYEPQDIVVYQNRWFVSKVQNVNQPPYVGSPYWDVVLQLISLVYPVQVAQPLAQDVGQLWFQIIP